MEICNAERFVLLLNLMNLWACLILHFFTSWFPRCHNITPWSQCSQAQGETKLKFSCRKARSPCPRFGYLIPSGSYIAKMPCNCITIARSFIVTRRQQRRYWTVERDCKELPVEIKGWKSKVNIWGEGRAQGTQASTQTRPSPVSAHVPRPTISLDLRTVRADRHCSAANYRSFLAHL